MSNPPVSVIIPVFNGTNYLREAIDSVLAQTYSNIELVVVDDGSVDSTWDIIESYGSRVRGFHKENGGVGSALNWGISNAQGEYIAWLSHDDIFLPTKIACQVNYLLMHPEYDACYTDFVVMDVQGKLIHTYHLPWYPRQDIPRQFLRNMYINGSTTLINKHLFELAGGFNEQRAFTQDMDMWIRISEYSGFGHIPQVLLKSRSHPEQGSWNFEIQIGEEKSFFAEMFQNLSPLRIFPELSSKKGITLQTALGLEKLGDETWKYRHWYSFAQQQYQQSYWMNASLRTKVKSTLAKIVVALLGSENDSLLLVRRARFVLGQGDRQTARKLSAAMLKKHPVRLDAILIWIGSFISPRIQQYLRMIKRSLLNSLI
jgi:glycosyltransferase involved in cell wall biosynthesis